mgnify:CR=1 FL=1
MNKSYHWVRCGADIPEAAQSPKFNHWLSMAWQRSEKAWKSKEIQMLLKRLSNTTVPKKLWEALRWWMVFIVEKSDLVLCEKIDRTKVG